MSFKVLLLAKARPRSLPRQNQQFAGFLSVHKIITCNILCLAAPRQCPRVLADPRPLPVDHAWLLPASTMIYG